jgi:hypothetical protein
MIFISPTSCREQLPDPEFFAQCIRDSFQEYLVLADRRPKTRGKRRLKKVVVKRKTAARKKAA